MAFNYATAQGSSGDVLIGLTPGAASDFVILCTSAYQTSSGNTPAGWNREAEGFYTYQPSSTSPVSFDLPSPLPASWTAIMLDLPATGSATQETDVNIDFGTAPGSSYSHTITTNTDDAIIWQMSCMSVDAPSFNISDTQGNQYGLFQNTQLIGGLYYTSFIAIAVGCPSGSTEITFNVSNFGPEESYTGFVIGLLTYSGINPLPPSIFAQVVPAQIVQGQSATLTWIANFTETLISPQLGGEIALSGSQVVTPDTSFAWQFTATGAGGTATAQVDLIVTGNEAFFSLQKLVLTMKQNKVPVRGRAN